MCTSYSFRSRNRVDRGILKCVFIGGVEVTTKRHWLVSTVFIVLVSNIMYLDAK